MLANGACRKHAAAVAVLFLVFTSPAGAKELLTKASVCGPAGCSEVSELAVFEELPIGGIWSGEPSRASAYYRIALDYGGHREYAYWIPATRTIAFVTEGGTIWQPVSRQTAAALQSVSAVVEPYLIPRITAASVGARKVSGDPNTYLQLFDIDRGVGAFGPPAISLELRSTQPSPWTDSPILYFPKTNSLLFGLRTVRLPDELAADVERADPLTPADHRPLVAGAVISALALAALASIVGVRRRHTRIGLGRS